MATPNGQVHDSECERRSEACGCESRAKLKAHISALEYKAHLYSELLRAVKSCRSDEQRHKAALRYIKDAEYVLSKSQPMKYV